MEPVEFIAVAEDISKHLDDFRIENNCMPFDPFKVKEKRQELTDALKYCIDLLKDAQIIIDLQNSCETISKRSQLMSKEIQRRIIDMLHFMEFEDDGKMVKCKEETLSCPLEEFSCSINNEKEQENDDIKLAEKDMSALDQPFKSENEYQSMDYVYENSIKIENTEKENHRHQIRYAPS